MAPRRALRAIPLLLAACGASPGDVLPPAEVAIARCDGEVRARYVLDGDEVDAWPDDQRARLDAASPTGVRLVHDPAAAWFQALPPLLADVLATLDGRTGFARQGAVYLRFFGDAGFLPATVDAPQATDALQLVALLADGGVERVPHTRFVEEDGTQVRLQPLRPLRPATPHLLLLTTDHRAPDGACVQPAPTHTALLRAGPLVPAFTPDASPAAEGVAGLPPEGARAAAIIAEGLDRLGLPTDAVSAVVAFTTHDDVRHVADLAADARATGAWTDMACTPWDDVGEGGLRCDFAFRSSDRREVDAAPLGARDVAWDVPAVAWLPPGAGPHPVVLYGHGLQGSRDEGGRLARVISGYGLAVVAADAVYHGDHPLQGPGDAATDFLGVDLSGPRIDGVQLRNAFIQTALDRTALLSALTAEPDLDGDGRADVDASRAGLWGMSAGAMAGALQLAIDPRLDAGMLTVPGGHLIAFATSGDVADVVRPLLGAGLSGPGGLERLLAMAQSAVDVADPAVYAAHILHDRLEGGAPHMLVTVGLQDEVVPPPTGAAFGRALGAPQLEPVLDPLALLSRVTAPTSGNVGGLSAAFTQLDEVDDPPEPARHYATATSEEVRVQAEAWWGGWADDGMPRIVAPSAGTSPAP